MSLLRHERIKKVAEMAPIIRIFSVLFVAVCVVNEFPSGVL